MPLANKLSCTCKRLLIQCKHMMICIHIFHSAEQHFSNHFILTFKSSAFAKELVQQAPIALCFELFLSSK